MVACLASFRALFTAQTISQRLPKYDEEQRNDPERQGLRRHGSHAVGNTFASISLADFERDIPANLDLSLGETTTFVQAKHALRSSQHDHSSGEQEEAISVRSLEARSVTLKDNHVHVKREFLVYPEAATKTTREGL